MQPILKRKEGVPFCVDWESTNTKIRLARKMPEIMESLKNAGILLLLTVCPLRCHVNYTHGIAHYYFYSARSFVEHGVSNLLHG